MRKISGLKFKDRSPKETVDYLKNILHNLQLEVNETWQEKSSINTWALRITFKNTTVGANGKGTSKEYAMASAYAELFERYQNDMFNSFLVKSENAGNFISSYDEKILSTEELIRENNTYINYYFKQRNLEKAILSKKIQAFNKVQRSDYMIHGLEDRYITIPFYSVKQEKVTFLPQNVYRLSYGSNGMSAGNTIEEAFVQGVAEIIERHVQSRLFSEKPILPTIPDEYIKTYPEIYEFYSNANKVPGYKCILKDCSFGGKYPVAALIVMEINTGKYGIKLGCHPDFGIAMERTFTEAAQGQDIIEYSDRSFVDFYNEYVESNMNIYNTYKVGKGQFPFQLFGKIPDFPFTKVTSADDLSNKEISKRWTKEIIEDGYDILVRNVSSLGFPSLHVIIPGMSEMFEADDLRYKIYNTRNFVSGLLMEPSNISKENCKYIITTMEYFLPSILENDIGSYYSWYNGALPCSDIGLGCVYMIAMCCYFLGDYKKASAKIKMITTIIKDGKSSGVKEVNKEDENFYCAAYYLFSAMDVLNSFSSAMDYIELMFDENIVKKVQMLFIDRDKVIIKQYPDYKTYLDRGENKYLGEYTKIRKVLQKVQMDNSIDQMINKEIF